MAQAVITIEAESFVAALYRQLLLREADAEGLADKAGRLAGGKASAEGIVMELVGSAEFVKGLPNLLAELGLDGQRRFTNDVTQYGELWDLIRGWVNDQAGPMTVVDVGARGRDRSNSYDLMRQFGWRGLLVEANRELIPKIEREFAGCDMALVCCAVSDYAGTGVLTLGINDDVSSLTSSLAEGWGPTRGNQEVRVRRLPEILEEHRVPADFDLLSIDIEGEDIKVLNDLINNSAYRPRWVIIEASDDFAVRSLDDAPFSDAVRELYELRGQTSSNLILALRGASDAIRG